MVRLEEEKMEGFKDGVFDSWRWSVRPELNINRGTDERQKIGIWNVGDVYEKMESNLYHDVSWLNIECLQASEILSCNNAFYNIETNKRMVV